VQLTKGSHAYSYDPSGFQIKRGDYTFPVFTIDDVVIRVDIPHEAEGAAYMVCDCDDYKERYRRFQAGKTYKKQQKMPDFGWDCVATCGHITLINRYFASHVLARAKEKLEKLPTNEAAAFLRSDKARLFAKKSLSIGVEYVTQLQELMTQ